MTKIRFEWDETKNASNRRKHGVSFEEASRVFLDPLHIAVADRIVDGEQRWQTLGATQLDTGSLLILLVAHTTREEAADGTLIEIVRIISARKATRAERRIYEEENS